ncbi:DUF4190 domain-containing protein [Mycolicibacterium conceptionense]|uniref:DUF4190 domain-containing protein n=1 Tax=Mycolicibacterium conceptionense TaxID=451644 RepID=UPI0006620562|nr:DUF4190 domain-containing protein [Mycolicibacterium conceptionense]
MSYPDPTPPRNQAEHQAQFQQQLHNQYPGQPVHYPAAVKSNSLALTSLITAIVSFFFCPFILSIAAIVTGQIAKKQIAESNGTQSGEGQAKWGVILGIVSLIVGAIFLIVVFALAGSSPS